MFSTRLQGFKSLLLPRACKYPSSSYSPQGAETAAERPATARGRGQWGGGAARRHGDGARGRVLL